MELATTSGIQVTFDPSLTYAFGILIFSIWFFGMIFYFKKQTILK
jgi:hypothetical protein